MTVVDVGIVATTLFALMGSVCGMFLNKCDSTERLEKRDRAAVFLQWEKEKEQTVKNYVEWKKIHLEFGNIYDASMIKDGYSKESLTVCELTR